MLAIKSAVALKVPTCVVAGQKMDNTIVKYILMPITDNPAATIPLILTLPQIQNMLENGTHYLCNAEVTATSLHLTEGFDVSLPLINEKNQFISTSKFVVGFTYLKQGVIQYGLYHGLRYCGAFTPQNMIKTVQYLKSKGAKIQNLKLVETCSGIAIACTKGNFFDATDYFNKLQGMHLREKENAEQVQMSDSVEVPETREETVAKIAPQEGMFQWTLGKKASVTGWTCTDSYSNSILQTPLKVKEIGACTDSSVLDTVTELYISANVEILNLAFLDKFPNLEKIRVATANTVFTSVQGLLCRKNEHTSLVKVPNHYCKAEFDNLQIPSRIKEIESNAFKGVAPFNILVLNGVERVASFAFKGLEKLQYLEFKHSVKLEPAALFGLAFLKAYIIKQDIDMDFASIYNIETHYDLEELVNKFTVQGVSAIRDEFNTPIFTTANLFEKFKAMQLPVMV